MSSLPPVETAPGESLGIASVPNLRDLGGYGTADGRVVRRGRVYRASQLAPVSPADMARLGRLGLARAFDLRTAHERQATPDEVPDGVEVVPLDVLANVSGSAPAALGALLRDPAAADEALGDGHIDALFVLSYRQFVTLESARAAYRQLFTDLADPASLPGLFHCTAGKDRTGWAAAALLSLCGVPRPVVMADYLRSNVCLEPFSAPRAAAYAARGGNPDIVRVIFGVRPLYLEAAFAEVETVFGSIEGYFADGLGLDTAHQEALRGLMLAES
ncbi:tyrosine-protein phosphatase [Segnochrobactraceae bacterium EtOH-i3]